MESDSDDQSGYEKQADLNYVQRASQSHDHGQSRRGRGTARRANGRPRGACGGHSNRNDHSWNRPANVTQTDTSQRPTNSDRGARASHPGGARPKEGRSSWRRVDKQRQHDGFQTHQGPSNSARHRADSAEAESEKQERGDTNISQDFFRRQGRNSYQGDSRGDNPRWRRTQTNASPASGRYRGQVQVKHKSTASPIPEKELHRLLGEQPADILSRLVSMKDEWASLLDQELFSDDLFRLTLSILSSVCDLDSVRAASLDLDTALDLLASSCFVGKHMSRYLVTTVTDKMQSGRDGNETIASDVSMMLKVLRVFLQHKPCGYGEVGVVLILLDKVVSSAAFDDRQADLMMEVQKLTGSFHAVQESQLIKPRLKVKAPPNNFRYIPIFPQSSEIRTPTKPFLRKNITNGRYQDVEHYLDVQFRLLREDFVAPLREGITEFLSAANSRHQDIWVYRDVSVKGSKTGKTGMQHILKFDVKGFKQMKWENNKRLLYGSFVCLTNDDFQHILCASVADRKVEDLQKGIVNVCFHTDTRNIPKGNFVMAESAAYFEAYRHVLLGLQRMKSDNFPFERYIVNVFSKIETPKYLGGNCSDEYDLRSLVAQTDQVFEDEGLTESFIKAACVPILDPQRWPTARALHLDESQKAAVQAALTKEFAIIQGPPGTGKTYIGLKIMELLLYNIRTESPILVVCYTNHALDQFLEGVLQFGEKNLVRVGGQSKSEALKSRNLSCLKRTPQRKPKQQEKELEATKLSLQKTKSNIERTLLNVAFAKTVIYKVQTLESFMTDTHRKDFQKDESEGDPTTNLLSWLNVIDIEHEENRTKSPDSNKDEDESIDEDDESRRIQQERQIDDDDDLSMSDEQRKKLERYVLEHNAAYKIENKKRCGSNTGIGSNLKEEIEKADMMTDREASRVRSVWSLTISDRWRLYRLWVRRYTEEQDELLTKYRQSYDNLSQKSEVMNASVDIEVLSKARVIGMTTTGAARCQSVLQLLGPRIVIVEEAAEVLEAQIITALSAKCQHLILIGDHQQLKPNPTVYRLAKVFNLDTSLFERMINNGVPCQTLTHQHQMRPEISNLMRTHFYKNLHDDDSVMGFDDIKGVAHNMFFIDHNHLEDGSGDGNKSKSNQYEAEVLVELCRYLLHQGYEPMQITILTTYLGQRSNFKKLMNEKTFEGVRVAVVDNFQGEENDIILLSLVRSNEEGSIGFLKTSNRVCVALSRARNGFYCIGNGSILKKSQIWQDIIGTLEAGNRIDSTLRLVCQNHPDKVAKVASADDFRAKVPQGGCGGPCEYRLPCGHVCELLCHPYDRNHEMYKCMIQFTESCKRGIHSRVIECHASGNPCEEMVLKYWPKCGHESRVHCDDFESVTCTVPCPKTMKCGHSCAKLCGEQCTKRCKVNVKKTITDCGHENDTECCESKYFTQCSYDCKKKLECGHKCPNKCGKPCPKQKLKMGSKYINFDDLWCNSVKEFCLEKCRKILSCGHACPNKCAEPCPERRLNSSSGEHIEYKDRVTHLVCTVMVSKVLPACGHTRTEECYKDVTLKPCTVTCNKELPCGHQCKKKCSEPCKCLLSVKKTRQSCGHSFQLPCYKDVDSYKCTRKCQNVLPCGHQCPNNCEDPCPGGDKKHLSPARRKDAVATVCQRPVTKKLPGCGHSLVLPCFKDVESVACLEKCTEILSCKHKCPNRCGEPCPLPSDSKDSIEGEEYSVSDKGHPFAKKCHESVTKQLLCGHTVKIPCFESHKSLICPKPCEKNLSCGHRCSRKCGEVCIKGGLDAELSSEDDGEKFCTHAKTEVTELASLKCQESVDKMLPKCGHFVKLPCYKKVSTVICPEQCQKTLSCGHKCPKKCGEVCLLTLEGCRAEVKKRLPHCNHVVTTLCQTNIDSIACAKDCEKVLPCGHTCSSICSRPCQARKCSKPCSHMLRCGHRCPGECGVCFQSFHRQLCDSECGDLLICGHICKSECRKRCSTTCDACENERVKSGINRRWWSAETYKDYKCKHKNKKSQIFKRACTLPCSRKLKMSGVNCNHFCIGVCGEPCPPFCAVCDKKEASEMLHQPTVRRGDTFIYLPDCGHLCETRFLDKMMAGFMSSTHCILISSPQCPKCAAPIRNCRRYEELLNVIASSVDSVRKLAADTREARAEFGKTNRTLSAVVVGSWVACPKDHVFNHKLTSNQYDRDNNIIYCLKCQLHYNAPTPIDSIS